MTLTSTNYDQRIIDDARKLAALDTIDDLIGYFSADDAPHGVRNPLPSFFGRGTLVMRDLVAIIDRQARELAGLREERDSLQAALDSRDEIADEQADA